MRCNAGMEGKVIEAIIDLGAEITAMSRELMEKLGYEIEESSNIIIKSANDQKERSLGIIKRVEILLEGEEVTTDMEVIENSDELLILGNDWIKRNVKNIDIDNGEMRIKGKYRIQVKQKELEKEYIEEMLKKGIIRRSKSSWASSIVFVQKKRGEMWFCVDYRKLNKITKKDNHPLPRIDEMLDKFEESQWFSSIDLASTY